MNVNHRISRHVAWDRQQGAQVTNDKGYAANGNRYLGENVQQNKMDRGERLSRYTVADAVDKWTAHKAKRSYNNYYSKARSDGSLNKAEQRTLKGLRRNKNVAQSEVRKDSMRRTFGRSLKHAAQNGRITPNEREKLQGQWQSLQGMRSTVSSLRNRDAGLDCRDSAVRHSAQGFFEKFQSADVHHRGHGKFF